MKSIYASLIDRAARLPLFASLGLVAVTLGLVVVLTSVVSVQAAGPWYVTSTGNDGNDCLSAVTPCLTISGALGKATSGDTIYVASGTYTGSGGQVLLVNKNVTLSGGWDSGFTTQAGMSVIDGQAVRQGIIVNSGITALIEHFTIQKGLHTGGSLSGGGIANAGSLTLIMVLITNNKYQMAYGGAGIYNTGSLTMTNTTLSDNTGYFQDGGGLYNNGGGTIILNSSLVQNNAGQGISNENGNITINNSTITGQTTGGASIYNNNGQVELNNTTVTGNVGGIFNHSILILNNSTLSANTQPYVGGGIENAGGTVTINSSTITNNASPVGGGIDNSNGGGSVTLKNTILAGNTSDSDSGLDCKGALISAGYNLIENTTGCTFTPQVTDLINVAPKLGPLQDNGGTTLTHALLFGSPAVNAGKPAGCTDKLGNLLTTDQRGLPRVGRCDIGALEMQLLEASGKLSNVSQSLPALPVLYTINAQNINNLNPQNFIITDSLPAELTFINGSLSAPTGTANYLSGVITWTGTLLPNNTIPVSFSATVAPTLTLGTLITNTALINISGQVITRTATIAVDGQICGWNKVNNPVLTMGANGAWDGAVVWKPSVLKETNYKLWYSGSDGTTSRIGYATSPNGINWTKVGINAVLSPVLAWEGNAVFASSVISDSGSYKMWYSGRDSNGVGRIGYATSPDGINWTKYGGNPVLDIGASDSWEDTSVLYPSVIKDGNSYHMWYTGSDGATFRIGHATSTDGITWSKDLTNPVLNVGASGGWDWLNVYGPSVVKLGAEYKLWYSGTTLPQAAEVGYAVSSDGSHWTRQTKLISVGASTAFDSEVADFATVVLEGMSYKVWYSGLNSAGLYRIGYGTAAIASTCLPSFNYKAYLPTLLRNYPTPCPAYYTDNFADPASGWPISDNSSRQYTYLNGQYRFWVKNPYAEWLVTPGAKATHFTLSVTASRVNSTSGAYGVFFGLNEDWSQFYEFLIDANYYSVWRYDENWSPLQNWTASSYISTGTNPNRLKVIRDGTNISVYVNNHFLTTINDSVLIGLRRIGLVSSSDNTPLDARFDDFALYSADCGASAADAEGNTNNFEMGPPGDYQVPSPPGRFNP